MTDENEESDEREEGEDDTQYGGGPEDIDAVEQTERRSEEVEVPDGDDEGEVDPPTDGDDSEMDPPTDDDEDSDDE